MSFVFIQSVCWELVCRSVLLFWFFQCVGSWCVGLCWCVGMSVSGGVLIYWVCWNLVVGLCWCIGVGVLVCGDVLIFWVCWVWCVCLSVLELVVSICGSIGCLGVGVGLCRVFTYWVCWTWCGGLCWRANLLSVSEVGVSVFGGWNHFPAGLFSLCHFPHFGSIPGKNELRMFNTVATDTSIH